MIERLIQFSFRYKLLVFLLFIGVCGAGAYALVRLPIDAFPDVSPNLVQVFAEVEGMAAEEVEQLVTRSVEVAMMGIPGVKKIRSLSSHGLSTVNVYFDDDVDIYLAHQLVSERLPVAEEGIPEGLSLEHGIEKGPIVSGMGKILAYYLEGDGHDITDLRTIQDWVVKRSLQTVPGVGQVLSQGGYVRQYQVRIAPEQLLKYDLTIDEVVEAVRNNNLNMGAGLIERGAEELMVRTLGLLSDANDIEGIVIKSVRGNPVHVRDVASVEFGNAFRRGVASIDDQKEIVVGNIYKLHGSNSFEVIRRIKERIEQINQTLPEGVKVVPFHDQSALVKNSIDTVRNSLVVGLVLVCVVAFVFLGNLRNALIMVFSLPFAILLTFSLMYRYRMPGDLISFGGVAIALGMIIDATIIMVEKIQASLQDPKAERSTAEVIIETSKEVGKPIFFAVAIIILVFLPIFTLQEVEGKMFRPLAFSVTVTMLGSLVYALVVAPVFYSVLHKKTHAERTKAQQESAFHRAYRRVLELTLGRAAAVLSVAVLLLALGAATFTTLGKEFIPTLQEGSVQILAHMNPNISLKEISQVTRKLEGEVAALPEVRQVVSEIGYGEVGPHMHHTNFACLTVELHPRKQWGTVATQEALVAKMDEALAGYPGVSISFSQPIQHEIDGLVAGAGTQVVAKLFGPDLEVLEEKVTQVEEVLAHVPGAVDVRTEQYSGQTQVQIQLDRHQIARHGLSGYQVQHTIHDAVGGEIVGAVLDGEKSFGINVRFDKPYRNDVDAIGSLLVRTPSGYTVPVKQLARVHTVTGLRQISREDTRRYISVQCNVRGRDAGRFVEEARRAVAEQVDLPAGYELAWGGQFELRQAANKRLAIIVPITLALVLIMLYGMFNSAKNVLLIVLNIPLAFVGGVFALALLGGNLSIPSSIGFIALFGIALTDGLVLVSHFEFLRRTGLPLRQAVVSGSLSKLRPVIMTTVTTALGLLPLILATGIGSEVQRPLAIVVVGGLSSSTLLTLIVLPALYVLAHDDRAPAVKPLT